MNSAEFRITVEPETIDQALSDIEHRCREILDALPAAIYTTDAHGTLTFANRAATQLSGREPQVGRDKWCVAHRLYQPDGTPLPLDQCPMAVALHERQPVRGTEIVAERPDGARIPVLPFPTPIYDREGAFAGAVNMLVDISSLKQAEAVAARRADEQETLYRFTDRLYRAESQTAVYDAALDAIVSALKCARASILLFDEAGVMRFVAARGLSEGYCRAVEGHSPWKPGDRDPQPICVPDIVTADEPEALKAVVTAEGIRGLAFIPLTESGVVIGKFMAYYDAPHAFAPHELDLAVTIARQLGFSVARKHAEEARGRAEDKLRGNEERLRSIFIQAGVGLVLMEQDCRIVAANPAFAKICRRPLNELVGSRCFDFTHPDDFETNTTAVEALKNGTVPVAFEKRYLDKEGRTIWVRITLSNVDRGQILAIVENIDARMQAEEALRESEERFRLVAESAPVMLWMGDQHGKCVYLNKALRDFWGVEPEAVAYFDWNTTIHPDDRATLFEPFSHAMQTRTPFTVEARYKRAADGEYRIVSTRAQPRFGAQGEFLGMIGVNVDVTEARRSEQQRTLLINELNHRVKNTLATVQSLAVQTMRNAEPGTDARTVFEARLAALSRAHDVLTLQSWEGADLHEIVERALKPFRTAADRFAVKGPYVRLSPKQALAYSMALHELATNASKYGALSVNDGRVEVTWNVAPHNGTGELQLNWVESGGPPVRPPTRTGFGSRLIQRSLAHDLGAAASIDYRPEGVVSVIKTPLEPWVVHARSYRT